MRGAAKLLGEAYPLRYSISAVIEGSLPIGGLSSSAAVIIAFLTALAHVNKIHLEEWETIMMAKAVENKYVGVNCGSWIRAVKYYAERIICYTWTVQMTAMN